MLPFSRELLPDTAISSAWSRKFWQSLPPGSSHLDRHFFSLSVAGNGTLIYGSYLPDSEDIPASAARVALFDTLAAMLAALVIIPAMATTGAKLDQGGPGLLFIYLPHLIKTMPGGRIIAIIFFRSCVPCRHDLAYEPL